MAGFLIHPTPLRRIPGVGSTPLSLGGGSCYPLSWGAWASRGDGWHLLKQGNRRPGEGEGRGGRSCSCRQPGHALCLPLPGLITHLGPNSSAAHKTCRLCKAQSPQGGKCCCEPPPPVPAVLLGEGQVKERRGREERLPRGNGLFTIIFPSASSPPSAPEEGSFSRALQLRQKPEVAALKGQGVAAGPNKTGGATFENGIKT